MRSVANRLIPSKLLLGALAVCVTPQLLSDVGVTRLGVSCTNSPRHGLGSFWVGAFISNLEMIIIKIEGSEIGSETL